MSISNLTALTIYNRDDLIYSHAGPAENGKYSGWVSYPDGRPLLNTESVFDSAELAEKHMTDLQAEITAHFGSLQEAS